MSWFSVRDDWPSAPPTGTKSMPAQQKQGNALSGPWTQERETKLRELYQRGLSATEIKEELGLETRNQVIGKVNRLGLTRGKHNHRRSSAELAARPARIPKPKPKASRPQPFSFKKGPPMMPVPFSPAPAIVAPICEPVTIMGLNEHTCHWPLSDDPRVPTDEFMYCGALTEIGESYCPFHQRVAYTGVPPRKFVQARPRG